MPSLRDLQVRFADGLLREAGDIGKFIAPGRFAPERLLQVYRNNVFESLGGALRAVYPVVERLVGSGFFAYAAHEFIRAHPPTSGNLHDFGHGFADFLAAFEPARELAYLPDTARLEWAWHEAFHAAEAEALDLGALATIPAARHGAIRFTLHPSVRLLRSPYPILKIWQTNQDGYPGDRQVALAAGSAHLLVARNLLNVAITPLSAGSYALLDAFARGARFAAACDAALAADATLPLHEFMQQLAQQRVLSGFAL